ncbi:MAG: hypothetical protein VW378_04095 [bacterium]
MISVDHSESPSPSSNKHLRSFTISQLGFDQLLQEVSSSDSSPKFKNHGGVWIESTESTAPSRDANEVLDPPLDIDKDRTHYVGPSITPVIDAPDPPLLRKPFVGPLTSFIQNALVFVSKDSATTQFVFNFKQPPLTLLIDRSNSSKSQGLKVYVCSKDHTVVQSLQLYSKDLLERLKKKLSFDISLDIEQEMPDVSDVQCVFSLFNKDRSS